MNKKIIKSVAYDVQKTIDEIMQEVQAHIEREELFYDVKLILSEIFTNALIHGNRKNPVLTITVEYEISDDFIKARLTDEGPGFNYNDIKDPLAAENIIKFSGRGLFLIRQLADEISFNVSGNSVTIVKKFI